LQETTRGRLDGPAYERLLRGAYWVAGGELTYERRLQALRAIAPVDAVLGGPSAAWALGARWAGPDEDLELVLPPSRRIRPRAGLRVRGDVLPPEEIVATSLGPATSAARTAFDLARGLPTPAAVPRLDALLRATGIDRGQVRAVAAAHPRARGRRRVDATLDLVDPGAASPKESELRLAIVMAGLPRPVTQYPVRAPDGRVVAWLDLAWPERRVGAEYDGADHRTRHRHERDLARHNALRSLGWVVIQVDAAQLRHPGRVVAMVSRTLGLEPGPLRECEIRP
jgi:hypothetical protein